MRWARGPGREIGRGAQPAGQEVEVGLDLEGAHVCIFHFPNHLDGVAIVPVLPKTVLFLYAFVLRVPSLR